MIPELVFFVVVICVGLGSLLVDLYRKQQFVHKQRVAIRMQTLWSGNLQWGPSGAYCYGLYPKAHYTTSSRRYYGTLALVDSKLQFVGYRKHDWDINIPFDQILGLGARSLPLHKKNRTSYQDSLQVHVEQNGEWRVYIFTVDSPKDIIREIQVGRTIPVEPAMKELTEMEVVTQANQDVYGQWHEAQKGELYIAPDRLVFNWRSLILFEQIRQVGLIDRGGLNPFSKDLVRIEYEDQGQTRVIGFLLHMADDWANTFYLYSGIPVSMGRKKKEG
jgi:hypothetical protein